MKITWSYLTLCDAIDCSLLGSSVHGILQARILEWVAIPFSRGSSDPGIKPRSPVLQTDSLPSEPLEMYRWLLILESVGGGKKLGGKEEVELSLKVVF